MQYLLRLKNEFRKFPLQLWIIMGGSLIFSIGSSMAWPYLNIFLQDRLDLPLRITTLLISLRSFTGILASFFAGSFADRFGRRGLMLASLLGGACYYFLMYSASSIWQFAILMGIWGALDLFYPVGSNAMIADLVPQEDRLEAYSLLRMMYNAGFAVGPIVGGILAARSYALIFHAAAIGYAISFVISILTIKETLHKKIPGSVGKTGKTRYSNIFKDKTFLISILLMSVIFMGSSVVFNLLSLYGRETYGFHENQISYVFTVNALMCVFLQLPAMRLSRNMHPFKTMIFSAFFYMIGIGGYALIPNILWYCLCMAVLTVGELLMTPTMSALTARLSPPDARGRYMSILSLAHPVGYGIGPAFAGYIYDFFVPQTIWINGAFCCLLAAGGFILLFKLNKRSVRLTG
jgi:MFS family permease